MQPPDIIQLMDTVFSRWFDGPSWNGWRSVLRAAYGLQMSDADRAFLREVAERDPPAGRVKELWPIIGRRGGKDSIASMIATTAAVTFDPSGLRPGERAVVACIAPDKEIAKIVWRYIWAFFTEIEPFQRMVTRTAESDGVIELSNSVDIMILTGSRPALLRGRPILCCVFDEVAHIKAGEDSGSDAAEAYNALLPGMATIPQSMLIGISTPYRKAGLLWDRYKKHYAGSSDAVLVIKAASHVLNPTLDTALRDRQMEEDPFKARAEWYAEFRDDISSFVNPETVDAAVVPGRTEIPPCGFSYTAFCDPSGGSSDSMTLCISHREGERVVVDAIREVRPPFQPSRVVLDFAWLLRLYGISEVVGDRYGAEWVSERFREHRIEYIRAEKSKSDLYGDLLPLLNSGMIDLLDHPRAVAQLCALERRTSRSGKDSVDHAAGGHDDLANCIAGAAAWRAKPIPWAGTLEWMRRQAELPTAPPVVRAQTGVQRPDGVPAGHVRIELIGEQQPSHYYAASGMVSLVLSDATGPHVWVEQEDARAMLLSRYAAPALRDANAALMAELAK
jgi:hypothetical protein